MLRLFTYSDGREIHAGWGMDRWPWTWVRVLGYVKLIQSVYQRAQLDPDPKTAVPPRWMFFDQDELDRWFEERKRAIDRGGIH